jgi:hypothetical protein
MKYVVIIAASVFVGMTVQTALLISNDSIHLDLERRRTAYKLRQSTQDLTRTLNRVYDFRDYSMN